MIRVPLPVFGVFVIFAGIGTIGAGTDPKNSPADIWIGIFLLIIGVLILTFAIIKARSQKQFAAYMAQLKKDQSVAQNPPSSPQK